jgi:predicted metallopeptidase
MDFEKARDVKNRVKKILQRIDFPYIDERRIVCYRSFGSKSRARARIWSLPRIWQNALNVKPHYVIEVLSEKFDKLGENDKNKVLIHELLHIPRTFSGALLPHRGRGKLRIDNRLVEKLFKKFNCNLIV